MFKVGGIYYDSKGFRYIIIIKKVDDSYFGISIINTLNDNDSINELLKNKLELYTIDSFLWYKEKELETIVDGYLGLIDMKNLIRLAQICKKSKAYKSYMEI